MNDLWDYRVCKSCDEGYVFGIGKRGAGASSKLIARLNDFTAMNTQVINIIIDT